VTSLVTGTFYAANTGGVMAQQFNSGDRVVLRSGGPVMTVVTFGSFMMGGLKGYLCRWFEVKNKLRERVFSEIELRAYVQPRRKTYYVTTSKGF